VLLHMSRPMTKQMWCCWAVIILLVFFVAKKTPVFWGMAIWKRCLAFWGMADAAMFLRFLFVHGVEWQVYLILGQLVG